MSGVSRRLLQLSSQNMRANVHRGACPFPLARPIRCAGLRQLKLENCFLLRLPWEALVHATGLTALHLLDNEGFLTLWPRDMLLIGRYLKQLRVLPLLGVRHDFADAIQLARTLPACQLHNIPKYMTLSKAFSCKPHISDPVPF